MRLSVETRSKVLEELARRSGMYACDLRDLVLDHFIMECTAEGGLITSAVRVARMRDGVNRACRDVAKSDRGAVQLDLYSSDRRVVGRSVG